MKALNSGLSGFQIQSSYYLVAIQVLTAASVKMTVFWDVSPQSLVEIYRRFIRAHSLVIVLMMEVVSTSESHRGLPGSLPVHSMRDMW
jgi:hypothetical protein